MSRKQTEDVRNAVYKAMDQDALRRFGSLLYGKGVTSVRTDKENVTTVKVDTLARDYKEGYWEAVSDALEKCRQYAVTTESMWSVNSIRINVTFTLKHKPMLSANTDIAFTRTGYLREEFHEAQSVAWNLGLKSATCGEPLLTMPEFFEWESVKTFEFNEKRGYMPLAMDALYAVYRAGREAAWRVYDGEDKEYLEVLI
jgi:hypothetical protein